jgi:hypothetical protein
LATTRFARNYGIHQFGGFFTEVARLVRCIVPSLCAEVPIDRKWFSEFNGNTQKTLSLVLGNVFSARNGSRLTFYILGFEFFSGSFRVLMLFLKSTFIHSNRALVLRTRECGSARSFIFVIGLFLMRRWYVFMDLP